MQVTRRTVLGSAMGAAVLGMAGVRVAEAAGRGSGGVDWHDVSQWGVEGKGWSETESFYDRLPAKAKGVVRSAVWGLSKQSAGMSVRFDTDAAAIAVRYALSGGLAMPHMPATGVSGVDLYAEDGGRWRWLAVVKPGRASVEGTLVSGLPAGMRKYLLYLPLYNGVKTLSIGVPHGAKFEGVAPRKEKPIVFYGTSILQGACASRPGMAFTNVLGRRLGRPVINLGFSGNGKMEPAVGKLLCELDAAVYAVDCNPNLQAKEVAERAVPLVKQLRGARPGVPIVLVEGITYSDGWLVESRRQRNQQCNAALRKSYETLAGSGMKGLFYLAADKIGDGGEGTVDGTHPDDVGMMGYAAAYEPVLRQALG